MIALAQEVHKDSLASRLFLSEEFSGTETAVAPEKGVPYAVDTDTTSWRLMRENG